VTQRAFCIYDRRRELEKQERRENAGRWMISGAKRQNPRGDGERSIRVRQHRIRPPSTKARGGARGWPQADRRLQRLHK
jgi:hypothetical protein